MNLLSWVKPYQDITARARVIHALRITSMDFNFSKELFTTGKKPPLFQWKSEMPQNHFKNEKNLHWNKGGQHHHTFWL
jgi:hypothetical protein